MPIKRAITISIDDVLLSRVDHVRGRLYAQAQAPDVEDRSALISHLFRRWLEGADVESPPALAPVSGAVEAPKLAAVEAPKPAPDLRQVIFNILERDPDDARTFDQIRALARLSDPSLSLRTLKDTLTLMTIEELIQDEDGRGKIFHSLTREGVPSRAAVDAGLIVFDFERHEATQARRRADEDRARAELDARRADTRSDLRAQWLEAAAISSRADEATKAADQALKDGENKAGTDYVAAHPPIGTFNTETDFMPPHERAAKRAAWVVGRAEFIKQATADLVSEAERRRAEARAARSQAEALAK